MVKDNSNKATVVHVIMKKKEGNVLFNDALNTFYLRLYGVRHMVKDNSNKATVVHVITKKKSKRTRMKCLI